MLDRDAVNRLWPIAVALAGVFCVASSEGAADTLAFKAGQQGAYTFDTGLLRGTLCADGRSSGLTSVVHIPTGTRLDNGSGLFGYYRIFTTNRRYGDMGWNWPGLSRLLSDGAVEITLAATEDRPFEMTAVYRWTDPATLDLETTVKPARDLSGFEVFLASYCSEALPSPYVCVRTDSSPGGQGEFLLVERSHGDWLMFPRDKTLAEMIGDGRWTKEPYPVDWKLMSDYHVPLAFRKGTESVPAVVLMAPRRDCFAVSTPYRGESHYSLYLSLFGRDIKVGQTATARTRLVVTTARSDGQILDLYQAFARRLEAPK